MKLKKLTYHTVINVMDKPFNVYWSKTADNELKRRKAPLIVEMELKFACMVVKNVYFHDAIEVTNLWDVSAQLKVFYRPVLGQSCAIGEGKQEQVLTEITEGPMAERFPKKLKLDFVKEQWIGEYG